MRSSVNRGASSSSDIPATDQSNNSSRLYGEFRPLARRLIGQYGDTPEMRKDLSGEIYIAFSELVKSYDASRGVPFRPYLVRNLTARIYSYARGQFRVRKRELSCGWLGDIAVAAGSRIQESAEERWFCETEILGLFESIQKLPDRQA